jgi:hypothetical protein
LFLILDCKPFFLNHAFIPTVLNEAGTFTSSLILIY